MSESELANPPGTEVIYESFEFSQAVVAGGRVDVAGQVGLVPDSRTVSDVSSECFPARYPVRAVVRVGASVLPRLELELHASEIVGD